jgi:CheY-like chemotaxis protein
MTTTEFHLVSTPQPYHEAPCVHCGTPFDFVSASLCNCIDHEQTFACPQCGSCACSTSAHERIEFWSAAPQALWDRRKRNRIVEVSRPQPLDSNSLPRPFALIVDDDPLVLSVSERALRAIGFTTLTNSNPEEAYSIANAILPDIVLTDALMPKLDGRDLCLRLKRDPRTSRIKVIVMSALYRGSTYRNEAFKTFQVDAYLEKPIIPSVLREAVDRLMPDIARAQLSNEAHSA